jgi:hypothetical protein
MKPQAAVQPTTDATVLEESYRRTPTVLGHLPGDLLRVVTAPVALAAVVLWWLAATPAAAGAPHTGLEGEPVAEAIAEPEATQTATSPVSHVAATMPAAESRRFDARNPPRQARRRLPRLLCSTSQSAAPREIQASGDHQVRRRARSSTVAQMLRPLHRER